MWMNSVANILIVLNPSEVSAIDTNQVPQLILHDSSLILPIPCRGDSLRSSDLAMQPENKFSKPYFFLALLALQSQVGLIFGLPPGRYGFSPKDDVDRKEDDFYAPRDRYSYVASLQHPFSESHLCVGTLILPQWILTYARCVDTQRFTTAVRNPIVALGGENIDGPFKERHLIELTAVHPLYNGSVISPFDVALLKLAFPSKIQPLITLHNGSPPLLEGLGTRGVSWSRLETGGPYSKRLLEIRGLTIIDEDDCEEEHSFPTNISCLRVRNGDICAGGTGGPIVIPSFPDRLIGIAIGSPVCNGEDKTTGYLSISHTREWIINTTTVYSEESNYK